MLVKVSVLFIAVSFVHFCKFWMYWLGVNTKFTTWKLQTITITMHIHVLNMPTWCPGTGQISIEKKIDFYPLVTPQNKNYCPRGQEIYNSGRSFLVLHYYKFMRVVCHMPKVWWPFGPLEGPLPRGHEIWGRLLYWVFLNSLYSVWFQDALKSRRLRKFQKK